MAYFPYVTPRGDITFPAFFIVVFKMAANSRLVELNKKTKSTSVKILKSFLHGVRYVVFCTWFQRLPFWSEKCFSLLIKTLIFIVIVYYCVTVISPLWILCSLLPLEHKIRISSPP